jgi:hypothetical protein
MSAFSIIDEELKENMKLTRSYMTRRKYYEKLKYKKIPIRLFWLVHWSLELTQNSTYMARNCYLSGLNPLAS